MMTMTMPQMAQVKQIAAALGPSAASKAGVAVDNANCRFSSSGGRGRGAKRGAARSLLEAHTAVFQAALDLELQEEWGEAEQRLQVSMYQLSCWKEGIDA